MKYNRWTKVLATAFGAQQELAEVVTMIDEVALRELLTRKRPPTEHESRLLRQSPATRRQLYLLADVIRAEHYLAWKQSGIDATLVYRAASSPETKPVSLNDNPDFSLTLYPLDTEGKTWNLHLRLSERSAKLADTGIRLIDDEGAVWMAGHPDADGELSNDWSFEESPLERLHRHCLHVLPG